MLTHTHTWLKQLHISYIPGRGTNLADRVAADLIDHFQHEGHTVQEAPAAGTEVILTTAMLGEPLGWRDALMFTARRRYALDHVPTVFTIVHATPAQFSGQMAAIEAIMGGEAAGGPGFAGILESATHTLSGQGKRGGAILYLARVLQIQTKCIRVLLVIGEEKPGLAYLFDLVGAHPQVRFDDPQAAYHDILTRIVTAASTREITKHQVAGDEISREQWGRLASVREMIQASKEFGRRDFFTEMIRVSDLAEIPGISEAISSQYSEGCFATWDPQIEGLVTTITGSARPVSKENISDQDLAVIVGIKPEADGALVRTVEEHPNHPPSSEAVEMIGMDVQLPRVALPGGARVPVIRSKLHGHRSIRSYDPARVEYVPLQDSYLHYPVSCSTDAQYRAIQQAFLGSASLQNPDDPRWIVFTVLPGHGMVIVEKWVEGKQAFQSIWEAMDAGDIEITDEIPQGPFDFERSGGRCVITDSAYPVDSGGTVAHGQ